MRFLRQVTISFIICLSITKAYSQGKINAPAIECLGNLTSFSYTPPSGLTVNTINWQFGDGFSSNNNTPTHTYGSVGIYDVVVQAGLSNGTTENDTQKLEVVGLPKPAFYYIPTSDTCFLSNQLCFRDTSSPAIAGQKIVSRLLVWGDGSFTTQFNPLKGDSICHQYQVPDKYTVKLELTDKYGCKSSTNLITNVVENIQTDFDISFNFTNCYKAQVCLRNKSKVGAIPANSHYKWYVDTFAVDTGFYFNSTICFPFSKSKLIKIKLVANANNHCIDSTVTNYNVVIDSFPKKIDLLDTVRCYGDEALDLATITNINRDDIRWYVDNGLYPDSKFSDFYFMTRLNPGIHEVKTEIDRGTCVDTIKAYFNVIGPAASMKAIDNKQCFSTRDVFFYDISRGINRDHVTYKWIIPDSYGDTCVNWRTKDYNKYRNCNESRDWFTRHKFNANSGSTEVDMVITDTITGCFDTAKAFVDMQYCSPILIPDTLDVCQGLIFSDKLYNPAPFKFSIDSGSLWRIYPSFVTAPDKGNYDLGFVFRTELVGWAEKYGDDSIAIHNDTMDYYDTVFRKQILRVHPPKDDSIRIQIYNECRPFRVTVSFDKGDFYKDENVQIIWADSGNIDSTFKSFTHVDSFVHIYNRPGFNASILVRLQNEFGCMTQKRFDVMKGNIMSYYTPKIINCIGDSVCFYPGVFNFRTNQFWSMNTPNNKVSWDFPDAGGKNTQFNPCVKFTKGGLLPFNLCIQDSFGCRDTLRDSVFVQDVRAGIKSTAKIIYCSELKQFFDSSTFIPYPLRPTPFNEYIKTYQWQFGDGTFSSFQKNPLQTLNTSLDKIKAAHAVETNSGCVDTIEFEIDVIGPKPYFLIKDTIGCNSLDAEFVNLSRNCKQYIWQFGDSLNSTEQVSDKQNVHFNYTKPGRYYISLVGIDTIFNPFTNKLESCFNTFPDKLFQKDTNRSVLVLPLVKTGITSIDTICIGGNIVFKSLSDSGYYAEHWDFGDSTFTDTVSPSFVQHTFKKSGIYDIKLNPYYNDSISNFCKDSAIKQVVVMGVMADFDIDPGSNAPLFIFKNKSTPSSASLNWDFGQGGAGSTDQNPSHNYGNDTGHYNVCLTASIPYGCSDTTCKEIFNNFLSAFNIGNVFTPEQKDGKNDQFDIIIDGEDTYDLMIYNRWGILVYESHEDSENTDNKNWNGKVFNTGEDCPSGTYYYLFKYSLKSSKDKIETLSGVITLIR